MNRAEHYNISAIILHFADDKAEVLEKLADAGIWPRTAHLGYSRAAKRSAVLKSVRVAHH